MRNFEPMQNAEEECGMRDFEPMQNAEEECGMREKRGAASGRRVSGAELARTATPFPDPAFNL